MSCVWRLEGAVFWEMLLSLCVAHDELRPQPWQQAPHILSHLEARILSFPTINETYFSSLFQMMN